MGGETLLEKMENGDRCIWEIDDYWLGCGSRSVEAAGLTTGCGVGLTVEEIGVYGEYDPESKTVTFLLVGHTAPIVGSQWRFCH